ncbi:MAG: helix-turn-helix domain-containing protein [Cellvibrionaceae bacterium]
MSLGDSLLSNHIDSIYECVLNENYWPVALEKLAEDFNAQGVAVALKQRDHSSLHYSYNFGWSHDHIEQYQHEFIQKDVLGQALNSSENGIFFRDEQLLPRENYLASDYYQEFDRPRGVEYQLRAVLNAPSASEQLVDIAFERNGRSGNFSNDTQGALNFLCPHFRRALKLSEFVRQHTQVAVGSIDALTSALFVVNESGRVLLANQAAHSLLSTTGFIAERDGCLNFRSPSSQQHFRNLLQIAAKRHHGSKNHQSFCSAWHAMDNVVGDSGYEVMVTRLRSQTLQSLVPSNDGNVVVFVKPLTSLPLDKMPLLEMLYKFTPKESAVVFALCNGETIESISENREVSPHTVRNQVKSAMRKAGVSSQHQLVSLILRGALGV